MAKRSPTELGRSRDCRHPAGLIRWIVLLLILTLVVTACQPGSPGALWRIGGGPAPGEGAAGGTLASSLPLDASIEGLARGPAGLVANNSIGLVADNSIGLVADNSIGLVADNSLGLGGREGTKYRVAAVYPEEVVARALVFLSNPDGKFFVGPGGQTLAGMTDASGSFAFPVAPSGTPVVVNVMLGQERRLVGFLIPRPGGNRLLVSMASSLVTEYLRDQARRRGKTLADFDLSRLEGLLALTQAMLDRGGMGPVEPERNRPDLRIPAVPALVNDYAGAVALDPELAGAWEAVLGYRPLAIDMPLATSSLGLNLISIAVASDGAKVALGLYGQATRQVWLMTGAELTAILSGPRGAVAADALPGRQVFTGKSSVSASRQGGGSSLYEEAYRRYPLPFLRQPTYLAWAPDGQLFLADAYQDQEGKDRSWIYRIDTGRPFPGNFDRLILAEHVPRLEGMAFDRHGNLYLADRRGHTIRRVAAAEASGPSLPEPGTTVPWPCGSGCEMEVEADRVATASDPVVAGVPGTPGLLGPGGEMLLDRPWQLAGDDRGILIADLGNSALRRLVVDAAGNPGALELVAGGGRVAMPGGPFGLASDDGAAYTDLGFRILTGVAVAADGRIAVADQGRAVLLAGGKGLTLCGPSWAAFPDGGDSRRARLPSIEAMAWFGDSLLLGTYGAPVLARLAVGSP